jgi:hypothetical protein
VSGQHRVADQLERSTRHLNDPKHWRTRAEEARSSAEQMTDLEAKQMMLAVAEDYERLAQRAEERALRSVHETKSQD